MLKPYFQKDDITIYHGDCLDVMPQLDPVDLVLTDPPYNSGLKYGEKTNDNRNDYWEWLSKRVNLFNANTVLIKHSSLKITKFVSIWPSRILI